MTVYCGATCNLCEFLDPKVRCTWKNMGTSGANAYSENQLQEMFLSKKGRSDVEFLTNTEPYVLLFKKFVSDLEGKTLLKLTEKELARSTDQGVVNMKAKAGVFFFFN